MQLNKINVIILAQVKSDSNYQMIISINDTEYPKITNLSLKTLLKYA